jgi:hypothetical protein
MIQVVPTSLQVPFALKCLDGVVHTYDPSYVGDIGRRIKVQCTRIEVQDKNKRPHMKNNKAKKRLTPGSSSRAPT